MPFVFAEKTRQDDIPVSVKGGCQRIEHADAVLHARVQIRHGVQIIEAGLLRDDDPRWMLPSQMRAALLAKNMERMTDREENLLQLFRQLPEDRQSETLKMLEIFVESAKKEAVNSSLNASESHKAVKNC